MTKEAEKQKPGAANKGDMSQSKDRQAGNPQHGGKSDKSQPQRGSDANQNQRDGSKQRD